MAAAANIVEQHCRCRDFKGAAACFADMERELARLQSALTAFNRRPPPSESEAH
jgi:hypothetical protein